MGVVASNAPVAAFAENPDWSAVGVPATDAADPNKHAEGVSPSSYSLGFAPSVAATPTAEQAGTPTSEAAGAFKVSTPTTVHLLAWVQTVGCRDAHRRPVGIPH